MDVIQLNDRKEIERRLRRDAALHLYELGDLDDFFWSYTNWYTLSCDPDAPIVLLYKGQSLPTLMALEPRQSEAMQQLLNELSRGLPSRFYAHFTEGLAECFRERYRQEPRGRFLKFLLTDCSHIRGELDDKIAALSPSDTNELTRFYERSHPDHWFDPRMLESGCYFGILESGRLVSVAGIHVYSPSLRVGVIGNVATDPEYRGRGMARRVCLHLCRHLSKQVDLIGLNVHSENESALRCYRSLGFNEVCSYYEVMHELKLPTQTEETKPA